ncbi:hypothetical protein [Paraburkholderia unamae]|uniref:Uncharacterized protein n=1 Tax=Paraburkholderia unamae TaxID=219649 RepID=A0ACC6RRQ5_9BURK
MMYIDSREHLIQIAYQEAARVARLNACNIVFRGDNKLDFAPYIDGIKATGFPFEHWTAERLLANKWQIISNRYYIDDDENKMREIDIIAYKASSHGDFDLRTVIIISCKKSEQHNWAFLSRDANHGDPNSNWKPVHFWSDHKPLSYAVSRDSWAAKYHESVKDRGVKELFDQPDYDVFAFQEMFCEEGKKDKKLGASKGDFNIYASVLSTIKAQLYEMSIRGNPARKVPAIYQFNLLCLADAKFIRLHFRGDEILPAEVDSATHIARYLVKRNQIFARVLFSTKENFDALLAQYEKLHNANKKILVEQRDKFYERIERDTKRLDVLIDEFRASLRTALILSENSPPYTQILEASKSANLAWSDSEKKLKILIDGVNIEIDKFNVSSVHKRVAEILKKIYRYEGDFTFDEDIPF